MPVTIVPASVEWVNECFTYHRTRIVPAMCWRRREMQCLPTAQPTNPFLRTHATVLFTFCANTLDHKYKQQPSWPQACVAWLPGLRGRSMCFWLAGISSQLLSRAPVSGPLIFQPWPAYRLGLYFVVCIVCNCRPIPKISHQTVTH